MGWARLLLRLELLAVLLCYPGFIAAQEGGGQAEIGFQQYYLSQGSQPIANISGLTLRYSQFVPDFGLVSASLAPALSSARFRTGEDYLSLTGLPWKGQHWNVTVGDFRLPGQLLATPFTNLYVPEINGRGFSMAATHAGRTIGFFYGTATIVNTPRVVLRIPVPQTLLGLYFRQKIGNRLLLGARLVRFSNDLAALQNTPGLLTLDTNLKTATTLSLDALYTFAGSLKWYGEAAWSTSRQDVANASPGGSAFSAITGPILETPFVKVRANYMLESASYFPLLGYYMGDREGPFAEVTLHPLAKLDIYGSASEYQNNVAKDPALPEFHNSNEAAGISVQLPARFSLSGQLTLLDFSSRLNAASPWAVSRDQQHTATLTRAFSRHNLRVAVRDFVENSAVNPQRQSSAEIDDTVHTKHLILGGGVRIQRQIAGDSRTSFLYHGTAQIHFGSFSAYTNVETGSDLQNRTLLATNTISTTVFGASVTLGKHWQLQGEAYRNNLIAELNPQSIFVLQGQGVFIPGTLTALNQWSMYFRVSRSFRWGQAGGASDMALYALAKAPLKGSIEGVVKERLAAGNRPTSGITVTLDQDRTATSDEEGRFRFGDVPEGVHRVSLALEELLADFDPGPNKEQRVAVYPSKIARSDLDVIPLVWIQGKVIGPPEAYLDAIRVRLAPANRYTTPDTEGNFYFYNLREGKYKLSVDNKSLPEYAVLTTSDSVDIAVAAGKQPEAVTFAFEIHQPAKPVRKVLDKQEAPAPQPAPMTSRDPQPAMQPVGSAVPLQPAPKAQPLSKTTKKPVVPAVASPPPGLHWPEPPPQTHDPVLGRQRYLAGHELAQQRRYREAIAELSEAIRFQPDFAPAYNARGYAWYQLHDYAAAILDLDQAIRLNPKYENAYHIRSVAQKALADLTGAAADDRRAEEQPSQQSEKKALAVDTPPGVIHSLRAPLPPIADSESAQRHYRAGRQLSQQSKYREAITEFGEAIRFQPDSAPSYNAQGYAWYQLHDYAAAIRDLDQALRINPEYANAQHIRSLAQKALADRTGAAADAPRAEEQPSKKAEKRQAPIVDTTPAVSPTPPAPLPPTAGPDLARKHDVAGRQLAQQRKYREAITEFGEAIRIKPDFAQAYNARGYAWYQLHKYAAAIRDLDQAIRLNPEYANAYHIRALTKEALADRPGAAADAQRAKELAR